MYIIFCIFLFQGIEPAPSSSDQSFRFLYSVRYGMYAPICKYNSIELFSNER